MTNVQTCAVAPNPHDAGERRLASETPPDRTSPRLAPLDLGPCENPAFGSIVAVELEQGWILGTVGEKIAGGLFEVCFEGGSGVFRLDELKRLAR